MTVTTRRSSPITGTATARSKRVAAAPQIEASSGNVFADLGLPDADLRLAKATYARAIKRVIARNDWTQAFAAVTAELTSSDMSDICRGKLAKFSMERLEKALLNLGIDIEVRLKPTPAGASRGAMRVVDTLPK